VLSTLVSSPTVALISPPVETRTIRAHDANVCFAEINVYVRTRSERSLSALIDHVCFRPIADLWHAHKCCTAARYCGHRCLTQYFVSLRSSMQAKRTFVMPR